MAHQHSTSYLVTVSRHSHVMHSQIADTRDHADALAAKFVHAPGTEVDITEVHDKAESDLTTHTREVIEDMQLSRHQSAA